MFIPCPFFLNGILVFTSVSGNLALSGRVTSSETIRSCSFESGARISCKFLSRLKFLSVGAMSHRFVQIPYRSISGEAVLQSPISARNSASNGATSWNLNSSGFRFPSKKYPVKSFRNSSNALSPLFVFPNSNTYAHHLCFVGKKGLYISENNENNPQFDENKLVFRCFTLQGRKK